MINKVSVLSNMSNSQISDSDHPTFPRVCRSPVKYYLRDQWVTHATLQYTEIVLINFWMESLAASRCTGLSVWSVPLDHGWRLRKSLIFHFDYCPTAEIFLCIITLYINVERREKVEVFQKKVLVSVGTKNHQYIRHFLKY